mmetsp:Transcript_24982/g.69956  ORF Transcript_24982/g.69956 Transcript_24982/m.69956 type:complete len:220 (+) Transcript_24982:1776-2435(+)
MKQASALLRPDSCKTMTNFFGAVSGEPGDRPVSITPRRADNDIVGKPGISVKRTERVSVKVERNSRSNVTMASSLGRQTATAVDASAACCSGTSALADSSTVLSFPQGTPSPAATSLAAFLMTVAPAVRGAGSGSGSAPSGTMGLPAAAGVASGMGSVAMKALIYTSKCSAALFAVSATSSWVSSFPVIPAAMLVIRENAQTRIPSVAAVRVSGAVLIP